MKNAKSCQQRQLISSFLEIAEDQTKEIAVQFLTAARWNLEEAINHFIIMDTRPQTSTIKPYEPRLLCAPHHPPQKLLFNGSFHDAKEASSEEDMWLLVHIQSRTELPLCLLNRFLWSNEDVSQAMEFRFMLWQVDDYTDQGKKISSFYNIDSADPPVVLLIDPITGQKMRTWSGEIEAESFLEDLKKYIDATPYEHITSVVRNIRFKTEKICFSSNNPDQDIAPFTNDDFDDFDESSYEKTLISYKSEENISSENVVAPSCEQDFEDLMSLSDNEEETCLSSDLFEFPVLTEELKGDYDRSVVCSICVRFPDGRRKQRKFLKSEPIQLLWSFCYSHMEESEKKAFKLVHAIPGASKTLDYGANTTFDQSGIANSIISVTWE